MPLFDRVAAAGQQFPKTELTPIHSHLSALEEHEFRKIFDPILEHDDALQALSPLLLLQHLPDFRHWKAVLSGVKLEDAWARLGQAVAACLDHQSERSTDIRWLKITFLAAQGRISVPAGVASLLGDYPNDGGFALSGAIVRSIEIALSTPDIVPSTPWPAQFWDICLRQTRCVLMPFKAPDDSFPHNEISEEHGKIYAALMNHFMGSIATTDVDPRHDGVFGLAFYAMTLVASAFWPHAMRPVGRVALRALVEVVITLSYLLKRDDFDLWRKYRSYGTGQAKLAFLKILENSGEVPKYVDLTTLEILANEDMWQEFVDINVGHWAGIDLRRMSDEAGVKHIYDKYYDWPSSFVHAQWPAVRNTVYEICGNPLHRLHRIPRPPRIDLEDVSWDAVALIDQVLDLVNTAYPRFELRLSPHLGLRPAKSL